MLPQLFSPLPTYGIVKAAAFLLGLCCAWVLARRASLDAGAVFRLGVYCLFAGTVGGRLLMLLQTGPRAFSWQSAGAFYGGLLAGLITTLVYVRLRRLPGLATADVLAPSLALGQSLIRVGCFAAGCCWGRETNLPWAVVFTDPEAHRLTGVPLGVPLHPAQIYQALAQAVFFVILWRQCRRPHRPGVVLGLYFVLEGASRFLVDFVRSSATPNPFGWAFTDMQWLALAFLLAGALLLRSALSRPHPGLSPAPGG